ncbi:heavy metal-binding domain-containing protein [Actinophytocola sp.]|uniref:heavy metal-binding domain-containing protein n=1 Tax=Actinophytocola sp. TaxID=1872138 RepID=UPI002D70C79B|nr:heavy metal-binding domain-containing protein [Actinophytocola sp.]HYQ66955.1 heavy metal-binding domain-containing protein [Actinophytocola sp.]
MTEGLTPEQIEQWSIAELEAGRLPVRAQERLAMMTADHAFTSDLTVAEHHAIRSAGFSPVGQVMGSCVYHIGYTGSWNCGYTWGGFTSGRSTVTEAEGLRASLYEARTLAMRRMSQECAGLGGDGVVAVRLTIAPFPAGGLEFQAIGTAVRADGPVHARQPFLSDLTGQDFAKLITAGWVPCGMVLGVAVAIRHDDYGTRLQARSWSNTEVSGFTELVGTARHWARDRLRKECARVRGSGVVVRTSTLQVGERACRSGGNDQRDHVAEAIVIGTAITPFEHTAGNRPPAPLPMMRLN